MLLLIGRYARLKVGVIPQGISIRLLPSSQMMRAKILSLALQQQHLSRFYRNQGLEIS
jgi:hypothetical protein